MSGCGSSDDDAAAGSPSSAGSTAPADDGSAGSPGSDDGAATSGGSASAGPSDDSAGDAGDAAGSGCAATGDGPPSGADTHDVVDVDGDGKDDVAWLTGGPDRTFGVTTASGATFSHEIDAAEPIRASAVVNVVGADATPIALVDVGRAVQLYSLAGCQVTVTTDAKGDPYTFDKGFTGYGTGVGCSEVDGRLELAGLDAVSDDSGKTFTVKRTLVDLSDDGAHAANGDEATVATSAAKDDDVVTTAQETSCGDAVAGTDGPVEPQG
ncbi:hypothetical protein EDF32_2611 [Cellulomonas sp. PhB143]|nr:hypothetical protein EDF32_2611 [Cellulomonas sp. PhB143]